LLLWLCHVSSTLDNTTPPQMIVPTTKMGRWTTISLRKAATRMLLQRTIPSSGSYSQAVSTTQWRQHRTVVPGVVVRMIPLDRQVQRRHIYTPKSDAKNASTLFDSVADMSEATQRALTSRRRGLVELTQIQQQAWNAAVREKRDVVGLAPTGSGKTLAFVLSALQRIVDQDQLQTAEEGTTTATATTDNIDGIRVLILCPTRELVDQIGEEVEMVLQNYPEKRSSTMYGGRRKYEDIIDWKRDGIVPTFLIGTPGRILDHLESSTPITSDRSFPNLVSHVDVLVLDEFDRLLEMGFRDSIDKIGSFLPEPRQRQTLVFSATMTARSQEAIHSLVRPNFKLVDCRGQNENDDDDAATTQTETPTIDQSFVILGQDRWVWSTVKILLHLMKAPHHKLLVFFSTKASTSFFANLFNLSLGRHVLEMHSDLMQNERQVISERFRAAKRIVMFTSDVSSRGMDYPNVSHVIQVGVPPGRETYIHRIGRTGRAGKEGIGILLLADLETVFLETLSDLDLTPNEPLQKLENQHRRHNPTLEEIRMGVTSMIRSGQADELQAHANAMYRSLLGFYMIELRGLGILSPQQDILNHLESLIGQMGIRQLPPLSKKDVERFKLKNEVVNMNVRERWQAGRVFDVGEGRVESSSSDKE